MADEVQDLDDLEQVVVQARAAYVREANKKYGDTSALWNNYAQSLHRWRVLKRFMRDG